MPKLWYELGRVMMVKIAKKFIINAQADKVWETMKSFDHVENYLPMVQKTELKGSGVGSTRTCTLMNPDGSGTSKAIEQLDYVNENEKTMKFSMVEGPFPVSNCIVSVTINSLKNNQTELDISTLLEPKGASENEVTHMFLDVYEMVALGLEKLHQK